MYMGNTFRPASLLQSDTLYGLGAWQGITGAVVRRKIPYFVNAKPLMRSRPVARPRQPFMRSRPVARPRQPFNVVRRTLLRSNKGSQLGWYQAVASAAGAVAQVYAAKEATKVAEKQAAINRDNINAQKELLLLESTLADKRATLAAQSSIMTPRNLAIAGGVAAVGTGIYLMTRKRRRK